MNNESNCVGVRFSAAELSRMPLVRIEALADVDSEHLGDLRDENVAVQVAEALLRADPSAQAEFGGDAGDRRVVARTAAYLQSRARRCRPAVGPAIKFAAELGE